MGPLCAGDRWTVSPKGERQDVAQATLAHGRAIVDRGRRAHTWRGETPCFRHALNRMSNGVERPAGMPGRAPSTRDGLRSTIRNEARLGWPSFRLPFLGHARKGDSLAQASESSVASQSDDACGASWLWILVTSSTSSIRCELMRIGPLAPAHLTNLAIPDDVADSPHPGPLPQAGEGIKRDPSPVLRSQPKPDEAGLRLNC